MKILLLAGTREARELACALYANGMGDVTISLAGETRDPASFPYPVRSGGFGGAQGLAHYLTARNIELVVDATHPFAVYPTIVRKVAEQMGVMRIRLVRPPWPRREGWQSVTSFAEAAAALPAGSRALLATGRKSEAHFKAVEADWLGLRVIDPPKKAAWGHAGIYLQLSSDPNVEEEIALMRKHRVSHLVAKNSGGTGGQAKLDAADALGIQTIMIERPSQPSMEDVETVDAALARVLELKFSVRSGR